MSVPSQTPYNIYTANGLSTVFAYEFYLISASDIQVTINGNEVTSGYTVSGVGNTGGGEVTFLTAPANGATVIFERVTPTYRLTDYQDNGDLLADTVNKDFDRLWMAIQRAFIYLGVALSRPRFGGGPFDADGYRIANLADPVNDQDAATKKYVDNSVSDAKDYNYELFKRTLRIPEDSIKMLPSAELRKNKIVAMNNSGDPVMVLPESGSAADVMIILASDDVGKGGYIVNTPIDVSVGEIIMAPAIITGRVNIVNARWNAPSLYAEEPEAAAANAAAINMMFSAGGRHVELDTKARCVNSPLIFQSSLGIYGAGRETTSLIWTGGDLPALARPNYTDKDAKGFSNVRVHDLKIVDRALERNSYYTIDLFNGNSSGLDNCWVDCPGRYDADGNQIITSDRYGVALGIARNSTLKGDNGFVFHMRNSRIAKGTLMANGTDGYISGCELWGNFRNRALEISGGCTITDGTQIVPGHEAGIFLFNDKGYDIDTLKIIGVYFDGSTDVDLFTGWGIMSAAGIGLVNANISSCNFWHMNKGGIYAAKIYSSNINYNTFTDCDSDDTGEDDIYCDDVYGSSIINTHARSLAPKNNNATRVNLGRNYSITAKVGYPLTTLGGPVNFNTTYARCRVTNPTYARQVGGSFASSFPYGALPDAAARYGEVIVVNGKPYASDGASWRDMSGDTLALETATDLHALAVSQRYYTSDITMHSNIPAGLTGAAQIEVGYISAGYRVITVISLKASGGIYKQLLTGGTTPTWGLWLKIA
ncbi:phage tail fiber protein [Klebsiella quasipneumoniae]|uniref:phage tail fiber domain-containing protein n=2 Tax=Klebsiella pneumoniae complex TaxID=3390273 RepID=UPI00164B243B|nr:phage tail fiber protein [Klebsiella quasipneumoniae]EKT8662114.1 hypothetical protein [Klebsiella quasipneumoniae]MBC5534293.1 hypothetical protein [Klebsiella quasipneumoniae]MBC5560286.1 hypothetical protein [Klebsiella quasipneumoniae]HBQ2523950.1 hypothetical protein [Klebsiella quasipneumoniae]